jgi:hypothetical protein
MTKMTQCENLIEAAANLGFTVAPYNFPGMKDWFDADGEFVGSFDAHDGWAYVHELRQDNFEAGNAALAASFIG